VQSGHVVSTDLVQAYRGADVGSNKPTDIKLRCTPHHLIDIRDPPVVVVVVVIDGIIILYNTILYS
jgi:tRNA A37 N6-isopentenylltransferase MiaA